MTSVGGQNLNNSTPAGQKYAVDEIRSANAHQDSSVLHCFQLSQETQRPEVHDLQRSPITSASAQLLWRMFSSAFLGV